VYDKFKAEPDVILGSVRSTVEGKHTGGGLSMTSKGAPEGSIIAKLSDKPEVHPFEFVTENL
jgi:hypothetical protein